MIETPLSYGDDAKKSQLMWGLFYPDQAVRLDMVTFDEVTRNSGHMFFQDHYLVNGVHVKIKLIRSRNAFCLMSVNEFKVKIDSAIMFVRKVSCCRPFFWLMRRHWRILLRNPPYVMPCARLSPFQRAFEM